MDLSEREPILQLIKYFREQLPLQSGDHEYNAVADGILERLAIAISEGVHLRREE
jgi:hypothetical protein